MIATPEDFSNRWHSSLSQPHPHWIEVHLAKPAKISTVILHFADPAGYPTRFDGRARINGRSQTIFAVNDNRETQACRIKIKPTLMDSFRLTIQASANSAYPNAAQISEIELYP